MLMCLWCFVCCSGWSVVWGRCCLSVVGVVIGCWSWFVCWWFRLSRLRLCWRLCVLWFRFSLVKLWVWCVL